MSSKSQELISTLLDAEGKAEKIVAQSRENRVRKLKDARTAAEQELDIFKQKEEQKFQQESAQMAGQGNDSRDLDHRTAQELKNVEADFNSNKKKTVDYAIKNVLDINLKLSSVKAEMLKSGRAG